MLDEEFFCAARKIRRSWDFDKWFGIETEISCLFSHSVRVISLLVEDILVAFHLFFEARNIDTNQGVEFIA